MCVTYLVDKLKAATNRVVEESPNAIIMYRNGTILYKNKSAEQLLWDIPQSQIEHFLKEISSHSNQVYEIQSKGFFFIKTFKLPQDASEVLLLVDMTKEKQQEERLKIIKQETFSKIEEMLSKQMRIAQEIAGLLGESIAETKSSFCGTQAIHGGIKCSPVRLTLRRRAKRAKKSVAILYVSREIRTRLPLAFPTDLEVV